VDDDELFRESVIRNLADAGFEADGVGDGPSALRCLAGSEKPDVLLLDWKMPGMSGIEVLRRLRGNTIAVPVVFLTVLGEQIYEEAALAGGAVDFVEKSRSFAILLRRIELALSGAKSESGDGTGKQQPAVLERGQITLRLDSSRASWAGAEVELTLTEFRMVQYMVERAGKDVAYRELYDIVHGEGFVAGEGEIGYRTNVRAFIKRIRQKFRDVDVDFGCIENYPGYGYRWRFDDGA